MKISDGNKGLIKISESPNIKIVTTDEKVANFPEPQLYFH